LTYGTSDGPLTPGDYAIRAYQRAGFKEFGRRREAHRAGGRAFDEVWMDCLATDFDNSTLRTLLPQPSRDH
jgi:hypothetical protein